MNFIDPYIERLRPHARHAGQTACAYAERIIARLDVIAGNTAADDPDRSYRNYRVPVAAGTTVDLAQVPSNEVWHLTALSVRSRTPGTAAGVQLLVDGTFAGGAVGTTIADGTSGIVLKGGAVLQLRGESAPSVDSDVSVQIYVERPRPAMRTNAPGMIEMEPFDGIPDPRQEAELESRHSAPGVFQGQNVNGDRRHDAPGALSQLFGMERK